MQSDRIIFWILPLLRLGKKRISIVDFRDLFLGGCLFYYSDWREKRGNVGSGELGKTVTHSSLLGGTFKLLGQTSISQAVTSTLQLLSCAEVLTSAVSEADVWHHGHDVHLLFSLWQLYLALKHFQPNYCNSSFMVQCLMQSDCLYWFYMGYKCHHHTQFPSRLQVPPVRFLYRNGCWPLAYHPYLFRAAGST